ncbi:hypothetical protein [Aporhodopirellula rubra]|uniref:hypothetical protein n=1 Tax=Aporhodopirellula rubra TaxID=980271 RepID=UPI00160A42E1|nr:hypothetical protein [Aporhodopirellula rubra]
MENKMESVVGVFLLICVAFGSAIGCIGFGVGLIFLSVPQAFGLGILSVGCGALFGAIFGGKRIMRSLIETLKEMEQKAESKVAAAE